jgi:hypothetical protein
MAPRTAGATPPRRRAARAAGGQEGGSVRALGIGAVAARARRRRGPALVTWVPAATLPVGAAGLGSRSKPWAVILPSRKEGRGRADWLGAAGRLQSLWGAVVTPRAGGLQGLAVPRG